MGEGLRCVEACRDLLDLCRLRGRMGCGRRSTGASAAYLQTPTPRQLAWHEQEYYAFIHFGHNTYTNEEWGWSQSTPDVFNPTNLDTDSGRRRLPTRA